MRPHHTTKPFHAIVSQEEPVGENATIHKRFSGLLGYAHDGGEDPSDSFEFSYYDSDLTFVTGNTFAITVAPVNDPPVLAINSLLSVKSGSETAITDEYLLVTDEDSATIPETIFYIETEIPTAIDEWKQW